MGAVLHDALFFRGKITDNLKNMMAKAAQIRTRAFFRGGVLIWVLLFASCAGLSNRPVAEFPERPAVPPAEGLGTSTPENPGTGPERPIPEIPLRILGTGQVPEEALSRFLLALNPAAEKDFAEKLAAYYTEEAGAEGVNHDVAFAQMCLETGFLRFGNLVSPDMNNFCGLGAIGPEQRGERFSEPRIGVRAHIQHLKAYATEEPPQRDLVDPRYRWVRYGSAPTIYGLAGTWAADKEYGEKIRDILE
ncbi:MAG: glucosaminidase domain-containing protein, partial [Treponema sp.]|nr:glucosaminidase domain-containing protein [Treponema sp.]